MNKKIAAIICLMLAFSFIFASCTKKKIYTDAAGRTYVAYTDENGETMTNSAGQVLVVPTDSSGNLVTNAFGEYESATVSITGINVDSSGKKIESAAYKLTVPNGWILFRDIDDYAQLRYGDEDGNKVDIQFFESTYEAMVKKVDDIQKSFVENVETVTIDTKEETKLKDGEISPVMKYTFLGTNTVNGEKVTAGYIYYVFKGGNYIYAIDCIVSSEDEIKNVDFESVIEAIQFK